MQFNSRRLAQLSGLLTEGAEDKDNEACEQCDEEVYEAKSEEPQTEEELEESLVRNFIRSELETVWASGAVFGRKPSQAAGVTMGFAGVGFKSASENNSLVSQVYGKLPTVPARGVTMGFPGVGFKNGK